MQEKYNDIREYSFLFFRIIGFTAIIIAPLSLLSTMLFHGLPFLMSISEGATIINRVSMILPGCIGIISAFTLMQMKFFAYNKLEKTLVVCMVIGFLVVAVQPCSSPYIEEYGTVGLLLLSMYWSNIIHTMGAVIGFGAMIFWILFYFAKGDKMAGKQTYIQGKRDAWYGAMGFAMTIMLALFILDFLVDHEIEYPIVFITEFFMLTFGGVACLIRGRLFIKDKGQTEDEINIAEGSVR